LDIVWRRSKKEIMTVIEHAYRLVYRYFLQMPKEDAKKLAISQVSSWENADEVISEINKL